MEKPSVVHPLAPALVIPSCPENWHASSSVKRKESVQGLDCNKHDAASNHFAAATEGPWSSAFRNARLQIVHMYPGRRQTSGCTLLPNQRIKSALLTFLPTAEGKGACKKRQFVCVLSNALHRAPRCSRGQPAEMCETRSQATV